MLKISAPVGERPSHVLTDMNTEVRKESGIDESSDVTGGVGKRLARLLGGKPLAKRIEKDGS